MEGVIFNMANKRVFKLATASAVAASALVAAVPASAASVTYEQAEKQVNKAREAANGLHAEYTRNADYKTVVDSKEARDELARAKAKIAALKSAKEKAYLNTRIQGTIDTVERANKYNNAVRVAVKYLPETKAALEAALVNVDTNVAAAEAAKSNYDTYVKQAEINFGKVYGAAIQAKFKSDYLTTAVYNLQKEAVEKIADAKLGPAVKSVSAINGGQITVNFNQAILESDLITAGGALQNVAVTAETVDGVTATAPGTLTPALSADGKTLTLTTDAGSQFNGTYTVEIVKNTVKSVKDGSFVAAYEGTVKVSDSARPTFKGLTYNSAGTKAYLEFSEPVNTLDAAFSLVGLNRADGVALASATTTNFTALDFSLHATKRNVVEVDLAGIDNADGNKNINVSFVGLKDVAGNLVSPNPVNVTLVKDVTTKAQAAITSVKRTSVNTLEVSFDKELATAPTAITIAGAASGAITATADPKVYEVALVTNPTDQTALTGLQNVTVTGWDGYNTTGAVATPVTKIVDFTIERVAPTITSTSLTKISGVNYLLVNLSEEVAIADLAGGTLTGTVSMPNGDLDIIPTLAFTAPTAHNVSLTATKTKTVKLT
jgi:trimeric autotransporter adhesin